MVYFIIIISVIFISFIVFFYLFIHSQCFKFVRGFHVHLVFSLVRLFFMEKLSSGRRETFQSFSFHFVFKLRIVFVLHTMSCIEIPLYFVVVTFHVDVHCSLLLNKLFHFFHFIIFSFIHLAPTSEFQSPKKNRTPSWNWNVYAKIWIFLHVYIFFLWFICLLV